MTTMSRPTKPRAATDKEISEWAREYTQAHQEAPAAEVMFVAEGQTGIVRRGRDVIAIARSHTMAKRIANALNKYTPNEKGE